jgi:hypothetical protein
VVIRTCGDPQPLHIRAAPKWFLVQQLHAEQIIHDGLPAMDI